MSTATVSIATSTPNVRPALIAWSAAFALGMTLVGAGLFGSIPLPVFGGAAVFLFFAVAIDVRSHRLPNVLTLPVLLVALVLSPLAPWLGTTSGPLDAASGAALGFALLIGPYAIGGIGAGDVKALMALGAWIGPHAVLGACAWALIAAGTYGLALLALRGELADYARRWGRTLLSMLTLRQLVYEPPAAGSGAASGIPFAVALTLGLAGQWSGGAPW